MSQTALAPSDTELSKKNLITQRILEHIANGRHKYKVSFATKDERKWVIFSKQPDDPDRQPLYVDQFRDPPDIELIRSVSNARLIDFKKTRGLYDDTKVAMKSDETHSGWCSSTGGIGISHDLPELERDVTFIDYSIAFDRKSIQVNPLWLNPMDNQNLSRWFLIAVAKPPQKGDLREAFENIKNAAWQLSPKTLIEYPSRDVVGSKNTLIENHDKLKKTINETDLSDILGEKERDALVSNAVGYDVFPDKSYN